MSLHDRLHGVLKVGRLSQRLHAYIFLYLQERARVRGIARD
jgi:hypothetical protein